MNRKLYRELSFSVVFLQRKLLDNVTNNLTKIFEIPQYVHSINYFIGWVVGCLSDR